MTNINADKPFLYPMRLSAAPKTAVWGGDLLIREYGKPSPFAKLAESWELSVRSDMNSVINAGIYTGVELREYIAKYGKAVVGDKWDGGRFPLLIKFIDARDRLSVQVHPDDAYSAKRHGDTGKTEMWYIVEAEPGAQLVYGLREGLTPDDLRRAVKDDKVEDCLNYVDVRAGEVYFIPSGLVHAIGAGILIAEIQQNCDITYRLYDYKRPDDSGKLRELHVEDACAVAKNLTGAEIDALRYKNGGGALADCEYFKVTEHTGDFTLNVTPESFACVTVVDGDGYIGSGGVAYPVKKGESAYLPAGLGECVVAGTYTNGIKALVSRANFKSR